MYRIFFLLIINCLSAQNYRFVYEYKMKPDLNIKDSLITDYMNLDTDGKRSYFYNSTKFERDSAYNVDKNFNAFIRFKKYDRNLNYIIEKDYEKNTIDFYDKFKSINLAISESEIPKWNIENEFMNINHINCQKATTNYKGRSWEAWFTKDYPISDGPYKFTGLPGIIVKLKDTENNHMFDLIQIKKINSIYPFLPKTTKKITDSQYRNLLKNSVFNSGEDVESIHANPKAGTLGVQLKDGYVGHFDYNELNKNRNINEELAKRLRRTNNPIEKY